MRRKLLLGNWKMNKTISEAKEFAEASKELVEFAHNHNIDLGVTPTFLCLDVVRKTNPNIIVGAQNVNDKDSGAFTGEISIPMLKEINIDWSLIGHSERRAYNGETNETCNKKILHLLENKMVPVYCVGETLQEFENGDTKKVVGSQVVEGLANVSSSDIESVVIAYEPVWSIGTGKNASKEIAQDVCKFIRDEVSKLFGEEKAQKVRILYGGSVKPENVKEYLSAEDIDGALVGGASLKIDSFKLLVENIA
ncbi:MAG: triose-phosphate isomerase [Bacilli bacterium]|nr:triose-phosphate isomerase [Bacilli bacterium]